MSERDEKRFWERDIFGRDKQASSAILQGFCRQMSFMLGAGVTLDSVMTVLSESGTDGYLKANLRKAHEGIMRGESLSQALESTGYFPAFMCNMCRIGEISDDLPKVMTLLADYYEETSRSRDEIRAALTYPAIVSAMMLIMILIAVLYVLPHYALVFAVSDVPLPALTVGLLRMSEILINQWWLVLPIAIIVVASPFVFVRSPRGREVYERCLLKITLYRQYVNLHVVQAMALMLESGQPLSEAVLAVSSIIPNKQVAQDLQQVAAGLQEGASFWMLLGEVAYMDPNLINMARIGEETGNMPQVFTHASEYSRYQFKQMSLRLNKLVEPAVTLVLGLVLGLVMLSIILPTFAMTELVGY